jgi:hypothetical protein
MVLVSPIKANVLGRVKTKVASSSYRNMSQHVTYVRNVRANVVVMFIFAALKQEEIVLKRMKQIFFKVQPERGFLE